MRNHARILNQQATSPVERMRRVEQFPDLQAVGSSGRDQDGEAGVGVLAGLKATQGGYPDADLLRGGLLTEIMFVAKPSESSPELSSDAPKPLRFAMMSGSRRAGSHDLGRSGGPRKTTRSYLIRSGRIGG